MGWLWLLAAFALMSGPVMAAGQLVTTTVYQSHPVEGTTASAILGNMYRHPIIDPDDGPAFSNLTHAHDLAISVAPTAAGCGVTRLEFDWHFVITLPVATGESSLAPRSRAAWTAFLGTLKRHEEHHRAIFMQCGRAFVAAAAKLSGPCSGLKAAVEAYIDDQYAQCMATQRAFDRTDGPRVHNDPFIQIARAEHPGN